MAKLTKMQRHIIQTCADVWKHTGKNTVPVHCHIRARNEIDEYSKNYATYNKQMYKLVDAGVIKMEEDNCPIYAYLTDLARAEKILADGAY